MSPRFKKTVSIVFLFLALSGWVWWLWKDWDSAGLTAVFLDVGQGDGVLLTIGNDFQIVIDGGPDDSLIQKLGEYMPWYDRTIEMVILTHPDWDHVTGLVSLTERYQIGAVLYTGIQSHNAAYTELRSIIGKRNIAEYYPVMGNKFKLPDDATLEVLHPFESMFGQKTDDPNDTSIVTRLRYQGITMLFTGDISQEVERALLSQKVDWRSDLLKVAHHGSGDSSIEEFIRAVSPAVSVIQVGEDNSYGHPAKRVLDTLEKAGSRVFRNDELGDIVVRVSLDGKMVVGDP